MPYCNTSNPNKTLSHLIDRAAATQKFLKNINCTHNNTFPFEEFVCLCLLCCYLTVGLSLPSWKPQGFIQEEFMKSCFTYFSGKLQVLFLTPVASVGRATFNNISTKKFLSKCASLWKVHPHKKKLKQSVVVAAGLVGGVVRDVSASSSCQIHSSSPTLWTDSFILCLLISVPVSLLWSGTFK